MQMINASSFRERFLLSLAISFDWHGKSHTLEITLCDNEGKTTGYRITELQNIEVSEDFKAMYVERCTFTKLGNRVYLSLDPYIEGTESDRDNYVAIGSDIIQCR